MENNIINNEFIGVKFDEDASKSIAFVAEALLNLTKVFNCQGINIDCLLKVNGKDNETKGGE
jgi:hypothetical protein